jgi:uridine kinase
VSGIDGCGKGYIASQLEAHLAQHGIPSVVINVDNWLNLPEKRFDREAPAENFYQHAIRFDELFANLVVPLREHRSIHLVADCVEETAQQYRKCTYDIKDVDVILVEGILLFKNEYRNVFDVRIWVECSFVTALARAIERGQEGLSMAKTIAAYENIYFPAQRIHFDRDDPKAAADLTYNNDLYRPQHSLVAGRSYRNFHSHLVH